MHGKDAVHPCMLPDLFFLSLESLKSFICLRLFLITCVFNFNCSCCKKVMRTFVYFLFMICKGSNLKLWSTTDPKGMYCAFEVIWIGSIVNSGLLWIVCVMYSVELSLSCFLLITFHLSNRLVQKRFFLVHSVSVSKVYSDNDGIAYGFALICSLNIFSQKDFVVPILLNHVIPMELKNSVKFGRPNPPISLGQKINFFGNMHLFPPFMKFSKNFSMSFSNF